MEGGPVRAPRPQADTAQRHAKGRDSRGHPFAPTEFPRPPFHRRDAPAVRLSRTEVWGAKEEDAHRHSRPGAVTGGGLPPNVSYERWPSASNPQSTSVPAASGGVWAAASPFTGCATC